MMLDYLPSIIAFGCIVLCYLHELSSFRAIQKERLEYWELYKSTLNTVDARLHRIDRQLCGKLDSYRVKSAVAAKLADRAFSMASSANVALVSLSKALQTRPQRYTKQDLTADQMVSKKVNDAVGANIGEWLRPVMSDAELDLLDKAQDYLARHSNGEIQE